MYSSTRHGTDTGGYRQGLRLLALVLLMLAAHSVRAEDCSDYPNGVLDGAAGTPAPSQLYIDRNCTIRNYPASNPFNTNISFYTSPGQNPDRWLVVFDNVVHTGQMACNAVAGHKIWFTNGSSTAIQEGCQNLLIPVEKIDKRNPDGQTTAVVGLPFTYTLTSPVLWDPGTGTVINNAGSVNDLHGVTLTDDLNATNVDLTYVSHVAYWKDTGDPVPHTFSNVGGFLTFDNFPIIPAGRQVVIELTVVLEDTATNAPGTQFINTAKWDFGRLIDGVFYEPLPGEWGITEPLEIAGPELVVTKTGPATLNLGESGDFVLDVQNTGTGDAWTLTLLDRLPDGASGGMCDFTPEILGARVYAADGVTPVPGKDALVQGTDFVVGYSASPTCELTLTTLTDQAVIGPGERLLVTYRTELDADSQNAVALTNVAGAIEWSDSGSGTGVPRTYTRTLTDGTVGTLDHEDAHTVTTALTGYFFEKTVANLTTGANPTSVASPGDRLRYTLTLRTTDSAFDAVTFRDDLGRLSAIPVFQPGSLALVAATLPPGADTSNTNPNGGTGGAGLLEIGNLSLPAGSQVSIQFDITLRTGLPDGTMVINQAELLGPDKLTDSDDPYVNGLADPDVPGDEDPTRVLIEGEPPQALVKATTQGTAAIGEEFAYRVTVPSVPHDSPLYDVRIIDNLAASAADLEFVSVTRISGSGPWVPVNTGTATSVVIEDPVNGIDIPAGEQAVVEITVRLRDTAANVAGLAFLNTAAYTYNLVNSDTATARPGDPGTSGPMTIVEPDLTLEKSGPLALSDGVPGTFTLDLRNAGDSPAYRLVITDVLPLTATGGMCAAPPGQVTVQVYEADGVTPAGPPLAAGNDFDTNFDAAPACTFTLAFRPQTPPVPPGGRVLVTYQALLDPGTQTDAVLTNVAGATGWASTDGQAAGDGGREYVRALTDGTLSVLDHEDAHTVNLAVLRFEKTVANLTRGDDPATLATPGDRLRYTLLVENLSATEVVGISLVDEIDRLNTIPAFLPGSLTVVSAPPGADVSGTDPLGGASGTGYLEVADLLLAPSGGTATVVFEVTLAPVIANGTDVLNQSILELNGVPVTVSDDPNVNGAADPMVPDDEDPTRVTIESAPAFVIEKVSDDLTGDPAVLMAGETLRYTITVRNVGTDDAAGVVLRDAVPANTSYVPGTTTLNGTPVPDAGGGSPLVNGLAVNAPSDPSPGAIPAGPADGTDNFATVTFDVVVDADVVDGTVISNQGFVSAQGGIVDQPSDDPATPVADDPTRDVVGNLPLLYAEKSVVLQDDQGSPGVVDPGDVLRYTITVYNQAATAATGVVLTDPVPANTAYVADTTFLNGLPVGRPDGGASPLAGGIDLSSQDLTPPLPVAGQGTISGGASAVVTFDLRVNDGVPSGTVISNQARVASVELPVLPTDGDGDPSTGPEPTVVVVGDAQQLTIAKQVAVVGGGPALPGAQLEYVVRVSNVASVPATAVVITDDLDAATPGALAYVPGSATLNGSPVSVTFAGSTLVADYGSAYGPLAPGADAVLRFRAVLDAGLAEGTTVTNVGTVTWNAPQQVASASVSIAVGGTPGVATITGAAWHDADFDNLQGAAERALAGWTVELLRSGQPQAAAQTDAAGGWRFSGLAPNDVSGESYAIRFRAPGAGPRTATLGLTDSPFTDGPQEITAIVVASGANVGGLNLPIDPNGVVYGSIVRSPVAGATLTLLDAGGAPLPSACFDDPVQQGQLTGPQGYYKFDLNFSDAACPPGGAYLIGIEPPATGFEAGYSQVIPPTSGPATAPLSVPTCPGSGSDALPATGTWCEAQPSELAPPPSIPARTQGTAYHVHLVFDASQAPGSSQIFNNHIPLDQELQGALAITKTTPGVNVSRGQLVPYTITVNNVVGVELPGLTVVDRYPAGFTYVEGSALIDGVAVEPQADGRVLAWSGLTVGATGQLTIKLLLAVGAGVTEGEYVNRAQVVDDVAGSSLSGEATATVRVVPDPTFDCTDVTGKVFDDGNRNGFQDPGEAGLAGVRVVTDRGLAATTDAHGRYHVTCAVTPREGRGSNFTLKLDDRTLPSGYRLSTEQVQVKRATRGKALKFNFGASIHRVVGLDMADPVFVPGSTEMRAQWAPRLSLLIDELVRSPATLRLSYVADVEDATLVEARLEAVKAKVLEAWDGRGRPYALVVEPEVFWRLGGPVSAPAVGGTEGRR